MSRNMLWPGALFLVSLSLVIAACVPAAIPATPTDPVTPTISPATAPQVTSPTLAIAEGASAKQTQISTTGALAVSFDPNPVSEGVDWNKGFWIYRVTLREINGVGITIKNLIVQYYSNNGSIVRTFDYHTKDWFDGWLPAGNMPANGNVITQAGIPVQASIDYGIFTYNGIDVNGHEIQATGRVDFTD